jgi:hypothetical protein
MPTIASAGRFQTHDRDGVPPSSLRLRRTVAARRNALTLELADGVDPASTPELALRAAQLTSERQRRQMIRTLNRTLADARRPSVTRALVTIVNRRAALEAQDAIQAMIDRLRSPEPVSARGMAQAERILSDGLSSPLYGQAEPGMLMRLVLVATTELDPTPVELPVAA